MLKRLQMLKGAEGRNFVEINMLNMECTTRLNIYLHNMESKVLLLQKDIPLCLAEVIKAPVPALQGK